MHISFSKMMQQVYISYLQSLLCLQLVVTFCPCRTSCLETFQCKHRLSKLWCKQLTQCLYLVLVTVVVFYNRTTEACQQLYSHHLGSLILRLELIQWMRCTVNETILGTERHSSLERHSRCVSYTLTMTRTDGGVQHTSYSKHSHSTLHMYVHCSVTDGCLLLTLAADSNLYIVHVKQPTGWCQL